MVTVDQTAVQTLDQFADKKTPLPTIMTKEFRFDETRNVLAELMISRKVRLLAG